MVGRKENMATKVNKYDKLQGKIMNYLLSGEVKSTLVGKIISLDHSNEEDAINDAEALAEWVIGFIKKVEGYKPKDVK